MVTIEGLTFNTVNITTSAGNNGNISPSGIIQVPIGNIQHFDILPDIGFSVDDVIVDGFSVGPVKHYVFKNVDENHTIFARFKYGDTYLIEPSPNILQFSANPGVPSQMQAITITASELMGSIRITAPEKFEISNNETTWHKTFLVNKSQLPYTLFARYNPDENDRENALGKITLCALDAYAEIIVIGNISLDIPENTGSNIVVYPNPTTGELIVTSYGLQVTSIEVLDIYGKKLPSYHLITSSSNHLINIFHLPSGIYLLAMKTESSIYYEKIIKH
jgi:hypothetical protein